MVRVGPAGLSTSRGLVTVSAGIHAGTRNPHHVWFRFPDGPPPRPGDAVAAAALLPAMTLGGTLRLDAPVSPRLLAALPAIQDIFVNWSRGALHRVAVEAEAAQTPPPAGGVGCFFSAGVDSWYSVLKHRQELSALAFVHGFDIPLGQGALRAKVARVLRTVGQELRLPVIEVETNLREFSDRYVHWVDYCGSALAAVALVLGARFRTMLIAASEPYAGLAPAGTHPLLDPLWSTETLAVVHDGCEATRVEKVARIAKEALALNTLRVCWENPGGVYNCGRCFKCVYTLANLRLAGAADRCRTFETPFALSRLRRAAVPLGANRANVEATLRAAERWDPGLARAMRGWLRGGDRRRPGRAVRGARSLARRLAAYAGRARRRAGADGDAPPKQLFDP